MDFRATVDNEPRGGAQREGGARPADERVASLFLWHFVEEIEHRSAALMVYDAVHDSYPYRLKTIAGVVKHLDEILRIISRGFQQHVPAADGGPFGRLIPEGLSLRALRKALRAGTRSAPPDGSAITREPTKHYDHGMTAELDGR